MSNVPCIYLVEGHGVQINRMPDEGDLCVTFDYRLNETMNSLSGKFGKPYFKGWRIFKQREQAFFAELDRVGSRLGP